MQVSVNYSKTAAGAVYRPAAASGQTPGVSGSKHPDFSNTDFGDAATLEISLEGKEKISADDYQQMNIEDAIVQKKGTYTTLNHLPAFSGIDSADQTIYDSLKDADNDTKAYVYDIIRQNFLVENSGAMSEEERLANISLGMKKAEYASSHMIPSDRQGAFLSAMKSIASLAASGTRGGDGEMDYGVNGGKTFIDAKGKIVRTSDTGAMMRTYDKDAYKEYMRLSGKASETGSKDDLIASLRFQLTWLSQAVHKHPEWADAFERRSQGIIAAAEKKEPPASPFDSISTQNRQSFLEGLQSFMRKRPGFLTDILQRELSGILP